MARASPVAALATASVIVPPVAASTAFVAAPVPVSNGEAHAKLAVTATSALRGHVASAPSESSAAFSKTVAFACAGAVASCAALRRRKHRRSSVSVIARAAVTEGYQPTGWRTRIADILEAEDGGRSLIGKKITVCGWVRTIRAQKEFSFLKINDGTSVKELQIVVSGEAGGMESLSGQGAGTSVRIEAEVVESEGKGQEVEISCSKAEHSVRVLGTTDPKAYPLAKKKHSVEFLRSIAHLRPRTNLIGATMRVRNALAMATHKFFQDRGFLYVHTPIITTADSEGAGEMFRISNADPIEQEAAPAPAAPAGPVDEAAVSAVGDELRAMKEKLKAEGLSNKQMNKDEDFAALVAKLSELKSGGVQTPASPSSSSTSKGTDEFFGQPAYLTVSGQLAVENYCCALGDVYTFGPTFRAENSATTRHLAEFWMIEPELAFADINDDMDCAEAYLRFCAKTVLEECKSDLEFFQNRVDDTVIKRVELVANEPFKRITYTEAVEVLQKEIAEKGIKFEYPVEWGEELQTEHERYLTEKLFKRCTIVYNYPKACKAFYMRENDDEPEDRQTVAAMDILAERVGEIVGGSQREERLDKLDARLEENGMKKEDYWWYRELREYGSVPHAGFGLGFERLIMLCTGVQNIRDVIPFPRYPGHAEF